MKLVVVDLGKQYGGAEKYVEQLIKAFSSIADSCFLITRSKTKFDEYAKNNINCKVLSVKYSISDFIRIHKLIKDEKVDIVSINGVNSAVFNLCTFNRCKTVTTVHSNAELDRIEKSFLERKLFVWLENFCLKRTNKIIAVSGSIKNLLVGRGIREDRIEVINNGIKEINYDQKSLDDSILKICFVGRLEKVKGADVLLKALTLLDDEKWICDFFGDGSELDNLVSYSKRNNIAERVHFNGFVTDIRARLNEYDVLVQPSRYEGLPITLIEAMNARTLIICTNAGGMGEVIFDGINGFTFEVDDHESLADVIKKVEKERRMLTDITENAYKQFREHYTSDVFSKKTISCFMEAQNNNV